MLLVSLLLCLLLSLLLCPNPFAAGGAGEQSAGSPTNHKNYKTKYKTKYKKTTAGGAGEQSAGGPTNPTLSIPGAFVSEHLRGQAYVCLNPKP